MYDKDDDQSYKQESCLTYHRFKVVPMRIGQGTGCAVDLYERNHAQKEVDHPDYFVSFE
jgi:hypothetical protein